MEIINGKYFTLTLLGAVGAYVFSVQKGFKGAEEFINKIMPRAWPWAKTISDLLLSVGVGSIIGAAIFEPNTPQSALAAGIGWVAALNSISKGPSTGSGATP